MRKAYQEKGEFKMRNKVLWAVIAVVATLG